MNSRMSNPIKVLSDRKLAASVAGAVAVLGASDAQAAPIYSGVQNVSISTDTTYDFDLNGDAVIDYAFQNAFNAGTGFQDLSLVGFGGNQAVTFFGSPVSLSAGTPLPGSQKFTAPTAPMETSDSSFDPWAASPNSYLGLAFDIAGATHYGWARLTIEGDTTATLHDWAYEGTPRAAIATGETGQDVPEPATLTLIALGAAGVGALRNRRKRQDRPAADVDQQ